MPVLRMQPGSLVPTKVSKVPAANTSRVSRGVPKDAQIAQLNCHNSKADNEAHPRKVISELDPELLQELSITQVQVAEGCWLDRLANRVLIWNKLTKLRLYGCQNIVTLPDDIWGSMTGLKHLDLR